MKRPTWLEPPRNIKVKVDEANVKGNPLGIEVSISVTIHGVDFRAVVPESAVDRGNWTVVASQVGEVDNNVLLTFPSSSLGTATWKVPKSDVQSVVAA